MQDYSVETTYKTNKHKDYAIVYIRVIAMLLVVLFHSLCYYAASIDWPMHGDCNRIIDFVCKGLSQIHLPLFVIVSGFLYGKTTKAKSQDNL